MAPERWRRIAEVFEAALQRGGDSGARAAFLDQACEGDAELRAEVESLLSQDVSIQGPLEGASQTVLHLAAGLTTPESIGPFRILGVIGHGGMGVVYRAEQRRPHRAVALKVLKPGLATPEILKRFEKEADALARLQHPGIARIYQTGIDHDQPYVAMELIDGLPLDSYTMEKKLSVEERVGLLARVCDAVHHAHERGVIHRDLKPANILVDETGQPKALDFGVARLSGQDPGSTFATTAGAVIGTLAYMSPEQITADSAALDARADIYSLGVILYELLAGRPPYATPRNLTEAILVVCGKDPVPLGALDRSLRGDLETIAAKALEKDKSRRYGNAFDLAEDLRRYLLRQPIHARPVTTAYQIRKFAQRHRALVWSLAAIVVALAAGAGVATWQAMIARQAERRAVAVREFVEREVLAQANPAQQASSGRGANPNLTMREALDNASEGIAKRFGADPETEAGVRQTVGNAYWSLGVFAKAIPHLERALELQTRLSGESSDAALRAMQDLAGCHVAASNQDLAEKLLTRLIAIRTKKLGQDHLDTVAARNDLAMVWMNRGDFQQAAAQFERAYEIQRRKLGPDAVEVGATASNLAFVVARLANLRRSLELHREALRIRLKALGPEHQLTVQATNNVAVGCRRLGQYKEAEELFLKSHEVRRRTLGAEHPDTLASMLTLTQLYEDLNRFEEAEKWIVPAAAASERLLPGHANTMIFILERGTVLWKRGRLREAEADLRKSWQGRTKLFGPDYVNSGTLLIYLGEILNEQKRFAEAESALRESIRIYAKNRIGDYRIWYARALLGYALGGRGRNKEGLDLLEGAYRMLSPKDAVPPARRDVPARISQWISDLKQR